MKLLKSNLSKNARHLLLISVCFILVTGVFSCSSEETALNPEEQPIGTDDASLLAWQMEKHFKTKAASSYIMAFVTTAVSFEFDRLDSSNSGNYTIDWGDGVTTTDTKTHTYSDGLLAHSIFLYGNNYDEWTVNVGDNEVIFVDISRCLGMKSFWAYSNRITNIDLSKNIELETLSIGRNNLQSIDVSNNLKLNQLNLNENNLSNIDVTTLLSLTEFRVYGNTLLNHLDITRNIKLELIELDNTNISTIDLSNNSSLMSFWCRNCPISMMNLSNNIQMRVFCCSGCTNIVDLNFSNTEKLQYLDCRNCSIKTLAFNKNLELFEEFYMINNPIEQDIRKMTSLALSLPDRSREFNPGLWKTSTPYIDTMKDMLDGYNWIVSPD